VTHILLTINLVKGGFFYVHPSLKCSYTPYATSNVTEIKT
jgi:hypothetical protein